MKKILSLILAGILLAGCLTACGSEEAETVEDTAAVETEAETEAETDLLALAISDLLNDAGPGFHNPVAKETGVYSVGLGISLLNVTPF